MYTIYEIPGVKVGCTSRSPEVRVRQQGYTQFRVVEIVEGTTWDAKKREDYWKLELGYGPDPSDNYAKVIAMQKRCNTPEAKAKQRETIKTSVAWKEAHSKSLELMRTPEVRAKAAKKNKKPILQYDKEGNFIREWPGIIDASKALNIQRGDITTCCQGKLKSSGGYKWKYKCGVINT